MTLLIRLIIKPNFKEKIVIKFNNIFLNQFIRKKNKNPI